MSVCFETHGHEDKFWNLGPMPSAQGDPAPPLAASTANARTNEKLSHESSRRERSAKGQGGSRLPPGRLFRVLQEPRGGGDAQARRFAGRLTWRRDRPNRRRDRPNLCRFAGWPTS